MSKGILDDMIAQFLYSIGKIAHSEEVVSITIGSAFFEFDKTIPIVVELKKRREVVAKSL